jgi:predicted nucleic acid-binding protein
VAGDRSAGALCGANFADRSRQNGFALAVMDGFFAATALAHALVLSTRNNKDFAPLGVPIFNPWTDGGEPT